MAAADTTRDQSCCYIIEQPASRALKFRYKCEPKAGNVIVGVNSTPKKKTYPAISIKSTHDLYHMVVSCVTIDEPYRPHPHYLIGQHCVHGIYVRKFEENTKSIIVHLKDIGIQCTKKADVAEALGAREKIRIDPFNTGFDLAKSSANMNTVRLCFQVITKSENGNKKVMTIVTDPIYDKKTVTDLNIVTLSYCSCPVDGAINDLMLVCGKVYQEDVRVRFYEIKDDQIVWEYWGEFTQPVFKHIIIFLKSPQYHNTEIQEPVNVYVQLVRPSDQEASEPLPFQFLPLDSGCRRCKRKAEHLEHDDIKRMNVFNYTQGEDSERLHNASVYNPEMQLTNLIAEQNQNDLSGGPSTSGIHPQMSCQSIEYHYTNNGHQGHINNLLGPSDNFNCYQTNTYHVQNQYANNTDQQFLQAPNHIHNTSMVLNVPAELDQAAGYAQGVLPEINVESLVGIDYNKEIENLSDGLSTNLTLGTDSLNKLIAMVN